MKVLFVNYFGEGKGGAEVSLKTLATGIRAKGHNVVIASTGNYEGFNCLRFKGYRRIPSFAIHNMYLSRFLEKAIKEKKIDIIHANDRLTTVPAILAAKKCKIPVVVHFRDYWYACPISVCLTPKLKNCDVCSVHQIVHCSSLLRLPWNLYKLKKIKGYWKILNSADAKIAISHFAKEKLSHCGIGDVKVIPNPVDNRRFSEAKAHKLRTKLPKGAILLSFIGHLTYIKGIENIMEVVMALMKEYPKLYFAIVGDGEQKPLLEQKIKECKLENRIFLLGRLSYSEIPSLYVASDLVLVPSLMQETFGRSAIEAMAAGKAVIASPMGGLKDVILEGKTGFLADAFAQEDWKKKIQTLINNKEMLSKMGQRGRSEAMNYSIEKVAKRVDAVYQGVKNASA